jgi:hypothetical protein
MRLLDLYLNKNSLANSKKDTKNTFDKFEHQNISTVVIKLNQNNPEE